MLLSLLLTLTTTPTRTPISIVTLTLTLILRLLKINEEATDAYGTGYQALKKVKRTISSLKKNVLLEFLEPSMVLTSFSSIVDIEIESNVYSLKVRVRVSVRVRVRVSI
jgi:hypothetical protein